MKKLKGGVYVIRNLVVDRIYIGSTVDFGNRRRQHLHKLRNNSHKNYLLQKDWNKYGEQAFQFKILALVPKYMLLEVEQSLIDGMNPYYNIVTNQNGLPPKFFDASYSDFTNKKRSKSLKLFYDTPDGKKLREKKRILSEKFKDQNMFYKFTDEQRKSFSKMGSLARFKSGYKHSEETKLKIGKSNAKNYLGFISPAGEIFSPVHNLSKFCDEHGLNLSCMTAVNNRKRIHHKGWIKYDDASVIT